MIIKSSVPGKAEDLAQAEAALQFGVSEIIPQS